MKRPVFVLAAAAVMLTTPAFAQQYNPVINSIRVIEPETDLAAVRTRGITDCRILDNDRSPTSATAQPRTDPFSFMLCSRGLVTTAMNLVLDAHPPMGSKSFRF